MIEAQASGKPIVSTKTGGIENIVIENKTALLSENKDIFTFSENLLKLIHSKETRSSFSKWGKQKSEDFSYLKLVENVKKLYKCAL